MKTQQIAILRPVTSLEDILLKCVVAHINIFYTIFW